MWLLAANYFQGCITRFVIPANAGISEILNLSGDSGTQAGMTSVMITKVP